MRVGCHRDWFSTCERDAQGVWVLVNSDWMLTAAGIEKNTTYADGIGVALSLLWDDAGESLSHGVTDVAPAQWLQIASQLGLWVHAYTVRADVLPDGVQNVDDLHRWLIGVAKVDGIRTDFPNLLVEICKH